MQALVCIRVFISHAPSASLFPGYIYVYVYAHRHTQSHPFAPPAAHLRRDLLIHPCRTDQDMLTTSCFHSLYDASLCFPNLTSLHLQGWTDSPNGKGEERVAVFRRLLGIRGSTGVGLVGLRKLSIVDCGLTDGEGRSLLDCLKGGERMKSRLPGLEVLDLEENGEVGEGSMRVLRDLLVGGALPRLYSLVLAGCGLGDAGVEVLLEGVGKVNLQELDLRRCRIGERASKCLNRAFMAQSLPTLQCLYLDQNAKLGDAGLEALVEGVRKSRLQRLSLVRIGMTEKGMKLLVRSFNEAEWAPCLLWLGLDRRWPERVKRWVFTAAEGRGMKTQRQVQVEYVGDGWW